jgi:hypothetical protein
MSPFLRVLLVTAKKLLDMKAEEYERILNRQSSLRKLSSAAIYRVLGSINSSTADWEILWKIMLP